MAKSFIEQSRTRWEPVGTINTEQIGVGCLQRIAIAVEGMQKPYLQLLADVEFYKRRFREEQAAGERMARKNSALRAVITRMKKQK